MQSFCSMSFRNKYENFHADRPNASAVQLPISIKSTRAKIEDSFQHVTIAEMTTTVSESQTMYRINTINNEIILTETIQTRKPIVAKPIYLAAKK